MVLNDKLLIRLLSHFEFCENSSRKNFGGGGGSKRLSLVTANLLLGTISAIFI